MGFIELEDAETGEVIIVDTGDGAVRGLFSKQTIESKITREKLFRSINMDYIGIRTDQSYIEPLIKFFRLRARRFR